jgi:HEPN domain-containing protein
MNRDDLQELANLRIREAKILFKAGEYSGAYYLAGYAVECALKGCIARKTQRFDFPDKSRVMQSYTHNLRELLKLAGLNDELESAKKQSGKFAGGWDEVCKWTEESRYSIWTKSDAEQIIDAIVRRKDGMLIWIKHYW